MRLPFWDNFINKKQSQDSQLQSVPIDYAFKEVLDQQTLAPVVIPYLSYYYGILPPFRTFSDPKLLPNARSPESFDKDSATANKDKTTLESGGNEPIHCYRFRRWAGDCDPCRLQGGVQRRTALAEILIHHERKLINQEIWKILLTYPPTHVLHLSWQSQITGQKYELLYVELSFLFPNCNPNGLAKIFSDYFVLRLQSMNDIVALCAPPGKLFATQQYLLVTTFFKLRQELYGDEDFITRDNKK